MTDDDALDQLASALLDGTATPDDEARLTTDPALRARVGRLAEVRRAVQDVPPPDPGRRDAMIAAALGAFTADTETAAAVDAPTRGGGRRRVTRLAPLVAAAAVLVLLAALVPALLDSGDDSSYQSTGDALASGPEQGASADDAGGADPADEDVGTDAVETLGDFDDLAALEEVLRSHDRAGDGTRPTATAPTEAAELDAGAALPAAPRCDLDAARIVDVQRASVAGEPVVVVHLRGAVGHTEVVQVHRVADCALLGELDLAAG